MFRVLMSYLELLPGAMQEKELPSGERIHEHLLAAFAAGDDSDIAAGWQGAHRIRAGSA